MKVGVKSEWFDRWAVPRFFTKATRLSCLRKQIHAGWDQGRNTGKIRFTQEEIAHLPKSIPALAGHTQVSLWINGALSFPRFILPRIPRVLLRCQKRRPAASTNASNNLREKASVSAMHSGCHCTPTTNRCRALSIASITPSAVRAAIRNEEGTLRTA